MVVLIYFTGLSNIAAQGMVEVQDKCLWVVRDAMVSERSIDSLIDYAFRNDYNNLFVQVRGRGDAFYSSSIVPKSILLRNNPKFDPLQYIIEKASYKGIKIHAWVNVYLAWSSGKPPASKDHVFNKYPDWIDRDGDLNRRDGGSNKNDEGYYLAPHHPEVSSYLLSVFRELTAKYEIDGLHLDYVRYKNVDYGNNLDALKSYQLYSNDNPLVFLSMKNKSMQNDPQLSRKMVQWSDYRRSAITGFVKDLKNMLNDVRPECILSAAVKPNLNYAKDRFYQEWDVWIAAGYLDWAVPMNYSKSLRIFASNIDMIYESLPDDYRKHIIMGIAAYNQGPDDISDKIKYSRITRFSGISIFSYSALQDKKRHTKAIWRAMVK